MADMDRKLKEVEERKFERAMKLQEHERRKLPKR